MPRSLQKGPFVDRPLLKKVDDLNATTETRLIQTWSRRSPIVPGSLGPAIAGHAWRQHAPSYSSDPPTRPTTSAAAHPSIDTLTFSNSDQLPSATSSTYFLIT